MHHIQQVALELISSRGFDKVTVEEVAAAAEVSPSSIYRYFGTKEGLLVHDEYDEQALQAFRAAVMNGAGPLDSFKAVLDSLAASEHFRADEQATRSRISLQLETPSVAAATSVAVEAAINEAVELLCAYAGYERNQARVEMTAAVWGVLAAVRNWYEDPQKRPIDHHFALAITALRALGAREPGAPPTPGSQPLNG